MKRLLTTLNIKIARCSVLRLSRVFQWSFESASLAEAVGGRSKMIRAALYTECKYGGPLGRRPGRVE